MTDNQHLPSGCFYLPLNPTFQGSGFRQWSLHKAREHTRGRACLFFFSAPPKFSSSQLSHSEVGLVLIIMPPLARWRGESSNLADIPAMRVLQAWNPFDSVVRPLPHVWSQWSGKCLVAWYLNCTHMPKNQPTRIPSTCPSGILSHKCFLGRFVRYTNSGGVSAAPQLNPLSIKQKKKLSPPVKIPWTNF